MTNEWSADDIADGRAVYAAATLAMSGDIPAGVGIIMESPARRVSGLLGLLTAFTVRLAIVEGRSVRDIVQEAAMTLAVVEPGREMPDIPDWLGRPLGGSD